MVDLFPSAYGLIPMKRLETPMSNVFNYTVRPNPRMQPTGRRGAALRSAGALPRAAKEAKVCAGAGMVPAADAQVVRRPPGFALGRLSLQEELVWLVRSPH